MRFLAALLLCLWSAVAVAQSNIIGSGITGDRKVASGGSCSPGTQAAAFFARTTLISSDTSYNPICNMINGMVADGDWALLDYFYFFSTKDQTTAVLNLVSSSFAITVNGACTFTANVGYTGNGSSCYLDTGYTPSTSKTNMAQNSGAIGDYVLTNRTVLTSSGYMVNNSDGTNTTALIPLFNDGNSYYFYNETVGGLICADVNAKGLYIVERTGSNVEKAVKNGSNCTTGVAAAGNLATNTTQILRKNFGGGSNYSTDQVSVAFGGGAVNTTNISARINTAMTTLGINVY